jgi:hypothetical protein
MTRRILRTLGNGRRTWVTMGWDRRAQSHRMVVELVENLGEPIFEDERSARRGTLDNLAAVAAGLGILLPPSMIARLRTDEALDLGNAESDFDDSGFERNR